MEKVYFFGTGYCAKIFSNKVKSTLDALGNYQIMGFLDNDVRKKGKIFKDYKIFNPEILKDNACNMVLIFLIDDTVYEIVYKQLSGFISSELIHRFDFPLELLLKKKYKNSNDEEIKETLKYISNNKLSVYNQFISENITYDEVKWDKHIDLPYIDFFTIEGKKHPMYYPKEYAHFVKKNEKLYVEGLMWEQSEGSPHLYIKENHDVNDGDYVIDAGVGEGNFALKYIDVVSHIYLFEMDPLWQKPLKYTFQDYENKVTIINKAVSDKTTLNTCRIDDVFSGHRIDFVKMDVEGAEVEAISGAKRVFCSNNIKSSICSYHRNGDEEKIRKLLEQYGYYTTVSAGYMLFLPGEDTWKIGDLRRGIVYGDKDG